MGGLLLGQAPGGGWDGGAFAQEEAVALCLTWALGCRHERFHGRKHLDYFYGDETLIQSASIVASAPGSWLDSPVQCAMAGFAAPNMRALKESGGDPLSPSNARRCADALERRMGRR